MKLVLLWLFIGVWVLVGAHVCNAPLGQSHRFMTLESTVDVVMTVIAWPIPVLAQVLTPVQCRLREDMDGV